MLSVASAEHPYCLIPASLHYAGEGVLRAAPEQRSLDRNNLNNGLAPWDDATPPVRHRKCEVNRLIVRISVHKACKQL